MVRWKASSGNLPGVEEFTLGSLERLHELGYIEDPRTKAKSVVFTPEGLQKAREAFLRLFALPDTDLPEDECLEAHLYGVPPERRSEKVLEILKAYAMQKSKKKRR